MAKNTENSHAEKKTAESDKTGKPRFCFPKRMHLRTRGEFDRVFGFKRSQADRMMIVYGAPNGLGVSRLGLVVSKKNGKAHRRNRLKRLFREVFRLDQHALPASMDLVIIPRLGIEPDFESIRRSFRRLTARLTRDD